MLAQIHIVRLLPSYSRSLERKTCQADDQGFDNTMVCIGKVPNLYQGTAKYNQNGEMYENPSEVYQKINPKLKPS